MLIDGALAPGVGHVVACYPPGLTRPLAPRVVAVRWRPNRWAPAASAPCAWRGSAALQMWSVRRPLLCARRGGRVWAGAHVHASMVEAWPTMSSAQSGLCIVCGVTRPSWQRSPQSVPALIPNNVHEQFQASTPPRWLAPLSDLLRSPHLWKRNFRSRLRLARESEDSLDDVLCRLKN